MSIKAAYSLTTGRPILGRARLLTEDLSLLAILLVLLTRQALVDRFLLLRAVLRPRGLLRFAMLLTLLPVQVSALLRLLRLGALRCLASEKKSPWLSPLAQHFAADLGSQGGGEKKESAWGR